MTNNLQEKGTALRKLKCGSCPFRMKNRYQAGLAAILLEKNQLSSTHYCHQHQLHPETPRSFCRGHRDIILKFLAAKGLLSEPTDEEFDRVSNQIAAEKQKGKTEATDR